MMEVAKEWVISLPSDTEAYHGVAVVTVASLWEKGMKMSWLIPLTTTESFDPGMNADCKKTDICGRLWVFFLSGEKRFIIHPKVLSLTKLWGMKTGLLRQHFLLWSVSKPPISPQSAPVSIPTTEPSAHEKQHQLASLEIISIVESGKKGTCRQTPLEPIG